MIETPWHGSEEWDRAVSPVIGVILMVAITVILAAVIGAFVLEIGDQQETAPSTSFDSEQKAVFIDDLNGGTVNATRVDIAHAGGDVLDITNSDISVEGNSSVWGKTATQSGGPSNRLHIRPQPDLTRTLGTNQKQEFRSGKNWEVLARSAQNAPIWYESPMVGDKQVKGQPGDNSNFYYFRVKSEMYNIIRGGGTIDMSYAKGGAGAVKMLESGENIQVVWTASSGGKTQTLFKYTVQ